MVVKVCCLRNFLVNILLQFRICKCILLYLAFQLHLELLFQRIVEKENFLCKEKQINKTCLVSPCDSQISRKSLLSENVLTSNAIKLTRENRDIKNPIYTVKREHHFIIFFFFHLFTHFKF